MPGRPTILLVDDLPVGLEVMASALASEGYRLITAASGAEALALAREVLPDVMLLDVMMPEMDGFEVCRRIRSEPLLAEMPVIMTTALDDRESRLRGIEAGADDFLSKPLDRLELRIRLRTITRLNRFRHLRDERQRLERIVGLSPDGILLVDEGGVVIEANAAAEQICGGRALCGTLFSEALAPRCHASFVEWLAAADRRVFEAEAAGSGRRLEIATGAGEWRGQRVLTLIVRDVTERDQLRRSFELAQRHEAVALAASGLAHDFGNYLMGIRAGLDLVGRGLTSDDPDHAILRDLDGRLDEARELVTRINGFARGGESLVARLDLRGVIKGMERLLRYMGGGARVTVRLSSEACLVDVDETQVRQIVSNLVVNARDAIEAAGRIDVIVEPAAGAAGECVLLSVSDTGVGMKEEITARIFEPFFTTKSPGHGTGLGLATVQRLVSELSGRITVESAPGVGTTFKIYLPRMVG
jgi:two-component system, cell cycle sensor histidine kinase and response regulator CckA